MAGASSGGFTPTQVVSPDVTKEVEGFIYTIVGAVGVVGVVNPTQPQTAVTIYNVSNNYVRGTLTFSAGVTGTGAPAQRVFLVPPNGNYNVDFSQGNDADSAPGAIPTIDNIALIPVAVPAVAGVVEISALPTSVTATAGRVLLNFTGI